MVISSNAMKPYVRNRIYWTMVSAIPSYRSVWRVSRAHRRAGDHRPNESDAQNVAIGRNRAMRSN